MKTESNFNKLTKLLTQEILYVLFFLKFIENGTIAEISETKYLVFNALDKSDLKYPLWVRLIREVELAILSEGFKFSKSHPQVYKIRQAIERSNNIIHEFSNVEKEVKKEAKSFLLSLFSIGFLAKKMKFYEVSGSYKLIELIVEEKLNRERIWFENEEIDTKKLGKEATDCAIDAICRIGLIIHNPLNTQTFTDFNLLSFLENQNILN